LAVPDVTRLVDELLLVSVAATAGLLFVAWWS
jgi:hypothetical protein